MAELWWVREHDCPWDWMTCYFAAANRHMVVLRWARAPDCPWDASGCVRAA
jgi:hypothetical protein